MPIGTIILSPLRSADLITGAQDGSAGSGLAVVPPDDVHHRVLAQADVAGDEPIRQPVGMHAQHALGFLVRWALANLTPEFDAPGPSRREAGLHAIPDQIRSRSNSARPTMMVRISLPLAVLSSKLRCAIEKFGLDLLR